MKDITAASGAALGTVYRYFSSKEHLVAEGLLALSGGFEGTTEMPPGPEHRPPEARVPAGRRVRSSGSRASTTISSRRRRATTPTLSKVFDEFARRQNAAFASFLPRGPVAAPRADRRGDGRGARRQPPRLVGRPAADLRRVPIARQRRGAPAGMSTTAPLSHPRDRAMLCAPGQLFEMEDRDPGHPTRVWKNAARCLGDVLEHGRRAHPSATSSGSGTST